MSYPQWLQKQMPSTIYKSLLRPSVGRERPNVLFQPTRLSSLKLVVAYIATNGATAAPGFINRPAGPVATQRRGAVWRCAM
jgi:hypothetical protein